MKTLISVAALVAGLSLAGSVFAQASGGPDAKGNAPLKPVHTVNDGSAKKGANSFTEGQARQHIVNSGYSSVSGLTKGEDGVWRGKAMKNGSTMDVALDFKGNVSTPGMASGPHMRGARPMPAAESASGAGGAGVGSTSNSGSGANGDANVGATHVMHHRRMRPHRRRHARNCAHPAPNAAACSGVDRNKNGVSDKEDRATAPH